MAPDRNELANTACPARVTGESATASGHHNGNASLAANVDVTLVHLLSLRVRERQARSFLSRTLQLEWEFSFARGPYTCKYTYRYVQYCYGVPKEIFLKCHAQRKM